ncbi:helix-turn-helix transcriptional regulator [Bacillaceae bacterium S4-13-58]
MPSTSGNFRESKTINVSSQVISNWERGYITPDSGDVAKVADALDVSTEYLLGRTNNPQGQNNYDTLAEINKLIKKYGIESSGFFDIEKWKAMGPEEIKELESYFQYIVEKAAKKKGND